MRNENNITESKVHDTDSYLQSLIVTNPCKNPSFAVWSSAQSPAGKPGLDVGCGIGLQTIMLAGAVGATGYVTGIDRSPEQKLYELISHL